jgi:hypothetical protein
MRMDTLMVKLLETIVYRIECGTQLQCVQMTDRAEVFLVQKRESLKTYFTLKIFLVADRDKHFIHAEIIPNDDGKDGETESIKFPILREDGFKTLLDKLGRLAKEANEDARNKEAS